MSFDLGDALTNEKNLTDRLRDPTEEELQQYFNKLRELPFPASPAQIIAALEDLRKRESIIAKHESRYKLVHKFTDITYNKERPTTKTIIKEGEDALEIAKIVLINSMPQGRVENGQVLPATATTEFGLVRINDEIQQAVAEAQVISQVENISEELQQNIVTEETKNLIKSITPNLRTIVGKTMLFSTMGIAGYLMKMPRSPDDYGKIPEAQIGSVPLYSVQRIERAKSDRKVKYRAIGDVFLAHQQGTQDSLRIDGTLSGPFRYFYLWCLIWLQGQGEGETKNVTISGLEKGGLLQSAKSIEEAAVTPKSKLLNYEIHRTFPIITQFSIMLNMYLQTIEWHREITGGQEVIKYHLLFRKWIEPHSYKIFDPRYVNGVAVGGSKIKLEFWKPKVRGWIEYGIDLAYKMSMLSVEAYARMAIGIDDNTTEDIEKDSLEGTNINMKKASKIWAGKTMGLLV